MNKKYTQGPWEYNDLEGVVYASYAPQSKGGTQPAVAITDGLPECYYSPDDYLEKINNARLISCAPELLEMLEEITEYGIGVDVIRKAKRLIAKAKGE